MLSEDKRHYLDKNEVAAVLPVKDNKVLMQLRDEKEGIVFPGRWGFFSGSLEEGESPEQTAIRELKEELNLEPIGLEKVDKVTVSDMGNLISHIYCFPLTIDVSEIEQNEGMDAALITLDEAKEKKAYSKKKGKYYPMVESSFVVDTISKVLKFQEKI